RPATRTTTSCFVASSANVVIVQCSIATSRGRTLTRLMGIVCILSPLELGLEADIFNPSEDFVEVSGCYLRNITVSIVQHFQDATINRSFMYEVAVEAIGIDARKAS